MSATAISTARAASLLREFGSCELADALTKLSIPAHIPNVVLRSPDPSSSSFSSTRICGPAHTVEFVPATDTVSPRLPSSIPHHVDVAPKDSVIVIKAPLTTPNAVWGGLMSARASQLGCVGVVVEGRIRDLREHWGLNFPVFSSGTSTLGASPYVRVTSVGEPITLGTECGWPVVVRNGDMIVADIDGVVRVPLDRVEEVVQVAQKGVETDAKCMKDLLNGRSIVDAFAEHRGKKKATS
ncbi:bifunctional 4-hydroxy-4-methyl-2-oxoglutarate aldolase/oxaloacetate decarboxylase [Spizellomyces punctatus DAOM BR117]|uniref:RraA-like protein n=1 Tax=Spizellomyces punctatus (strain DAOM BR117) TaxID=645134 RepID=A0A0L0HHT9_SPIPD|nr:bifunctional 4-hydroxy-4-methyl-2-oxoglutarate aldolase/oxaloacetate decarboxylase [Spizellomyces punctatus DAOM BR117]KND00652.1 hypothetical protein SPPG_03777 [Spizellomyces punctatus DAOM BR117]|eukprot:XP_016608691.1 hypothetical protein SPPG_03777 [Spizellomyces punctatus DAOM BR117]